MHEQRTEIIDSIPALIHTSRPDGDSDCFNQRWLNYAGLRIEDLLGWKWTAAIHPEDVEVMVDKLRSSIARWESFLHQARVRRADGVYRWMLHHQVAVRDECGRVVKGMDRVSILMIESRRRTKSANRKQNSS
jgi:PAS domain S-box-containing protein